MKHIYFVTQNNYKFQKFQEVVNTPNFYFEQISISTPEIQAENNQAVADYSAQWAANKLNSAVICEDVGLYIHAYNGFPGPYLSQVEKWLNTSGFIKLMNGIKDRSAYWEYAISYCEPNAKPICFSTIHKGNIAHKASGTKGWCADKIFIPDSNNKTIAQLLDEDLYVRNRDHYENLIKHLESLFGK